MFCMAGVVRADTLAPPVVVGVIIAVVAAEEPECIAITFTPPSGIGSVVTVQVSVPLVAEINRNSIQFLCACKPVGEWLIV